MTLPAPPTPTAPQPRTPLSAHRTVLLLYGVSLVVGTILLVIEELRLLRAMQLVTNQTVTDA